MTLIILLITIGVSVYAFYNRNVYESLSLKPTLVYHQNQFHRVFTHSLVHADWTHLIVNMYVFYMFGAVCEDYFKYYFGNSATLSFGLLYVLSIVFSSAYSIFKHKDNSHYSAVGASGAVMAVVFTSIFFDPWNKLWFFGIIPIPGILFGILYLAYSFYMGKRNADNIGHDAHFTGAIFGFLFPIIREPSLFNDFISRLLHP